MGMVMDVKDFETIKKIKFKPKMKLNHSIYNNFTSENFIIFQPRTDRECMEAAKIEPDLRLCPD